jgi:hypothetical protein
MKHLLQAPSTTVLTMATAVVALLAALLLGLLAPAWADPMRPLNPPPNPTPAQPANPTNHPAPAAPAWPALLALRQDSDGRHRALFGERWLAVGDRMGDSNASVVITAIDGHSVQLRQGPQRHTLHLLPPLRYSTVATSTVAPSPPVSATRAPARGPARAPALDSGSTISASAPGR